MKVTMYVLTILDSEGKEIIVNKNGEKIELKNVQFYKSLENAEKAQKATRNTVKKYQLPVSENHYQRVIGKEIKTDNDNFIIKWHLDNLLIVENGLNVKDVTVEVHF